MSGKEMVVVALVCLLLTVLGIVAIGTVKDRISKSNQGMEDVTEERLEAVSKTQVIANYSFFVIRDKKTGKEFLIVSGRPIPLEE